MQKQEEIEQPLVEQLKDALGEQTPTATAKKRPFYGFKIGLEANVEGLSLQTEVRYQKIDSKDVDLAIKIVSRQKSTGLPVTSGFIGKYHKGFYRYENVKIPFTEEEIRTAFDTTVEEEPLNFSEWAEKNKEVLYKLELQQIEIPAADVEYFQVLDGKEEPVEKFSRTKTLKILKVIPATKLDSYLIEDTYEIWSNSIPALWRFAEWLDKHDKIAVSKFSFGNGFKESYALIYPHIEDGKFLLVMSLTRMNLTYKHLMPIIIEDDQPTKNVAQTLTLDI